MMILESIRLGSLYIPQDMSATQLREELMFYYPHDALPADLAHKESDVNELMPRTGGVYWRKKSELNHIVKLRLWWFAVQGEVCYVDDNRLLKGRMVCAAHYAPLTCCAWFIVS